MWMIVGLLILASILNLLSGNTEDALIIAAIVFVVTLIKLVIQNLSLEKKYTQLEQRFNTLIDFVDEKFVSFPTTEQPHHEKTKHTKSTTTVLSESATVSLVQNVINDNQPNTLAQETQTSLKSITPLNKIIHKMTHHVKEYFSTGNPLIKVGGVILFFGLSFLIKFSVTNDIISVELGILSVVIFAIGLTGTGFYYRHRQGAFGLILQGIGIGVFYLAIFSAAKYFEVISLPLALGIMVATIVFASFLAIIQDAFYLAIFATVGGFLAPILTSTGQGSHVILFSYYIFLNLSIISIAWFKSWRLLNLLGFSFTFIIGGAWGVRSYTPELFYTTEPFLIFFFLLYLGVAILFAYRTQFKLKAYVDTTLVFGLPTVAFGIQTAIANNTPYLLSFSALIVSGIYLSLALWLRKKEVFSLLSESFLALGVIFMSLVFALALDPSMTAIIYALEASGIIWISLKQERLYSRIFALGLLVYAILSQINTMKYIYDVSDFTLTYLLTNLIISIGFLLSAFIYEKFNSLIRPWEKHLANILLSMGLIIWVYAGFSELKDSDYAYFLLYLSFSALAMLYISLQFSWRGLQVALEAFFPLALLSLLLYRSDVTHLFQNYGAIALVIFITIYYTLLKKLTFKFTPYWHLVGLWLSLAVLSSEGVYAIKSYSITLALTWTPLLFIAALYLILNTKKFWPLSEKSDLYQNQGVKGIVVFFAFWELAAFTHTAQLDALPYLPLLNPLALMQVSVVFAITYWLQKTDVKKQHIIKFLGVSFLLFATLLLARSIHFYADVGFSISSLQSSRIFGTGISILYTLISLAIIIYAKKRDDRKVWMVGAGLLGFVIFKLLFLELSQSGTLERIISFLVVGVLILIIGFIAPLPPKKEELQNA